jgi:hypothetical protein
MIAKQDDAVNSARKLAGKVSYKIWDRRTAEVRGEYDMPDGSAKSENAAVRLAGFSKADSHFAEIETRFVAE